MMDDTWTESDELKVMYMWPFKWPQLKDLFTDTAGNKLFIGKKVYLKHLPRRIRMWNVVFKEKEEPENLEKKKKTLGGTERPNNSDVETWTRDLGSREAIILNISVKGGRLFKGGD